ncbi:MAG: MFS transporter [Candidatus Hadarchaeum sp.]|uniref:MFS transporter n=1 Tax=Candidatus Hadarchaeum sp. TaxID=2883567 RepID=UPI003D131CA1
MEEKIRKKSLKYSIKDGVAWSVNSGLGNSYIAPYALALNANAAQIGLLTSVPTLVASLSELKAPKLMEKTSRKRIVTTCALLQALFWIPISLVALLFLFCRVDGIIAPTLVILFYTGYLLLGSLSTPAWSSWMGDLVREKERGKFFGNRNMIIGISGILAMLAGGFFLNALSSDKVLFGFVTLFLIAMVARLISWYFLSKQYEPRFEYKDEFYFSFYSFVRKAKDNNFGRFTIYITLMTLVVYFAAPFFSVYMLQELKFSYLNYVIVVLSSSLTHVLFMPMWGKFSDKHGNLLVLKISGYLIPFVPILWLFSTNPVFLVLVEAFSGFAWAGFDLASVNFIYDAVSKQRMGICFAYFWMLNGIGTFVGATLGGLFATYFKVGFISIFLFLFLISGILRLAVSAVMLPHLKEVRKVAPVRPLWYFVGGVIRRRPPLRSH